MNPNKKVYSFRLDALDLAKLDEAARNVAVEMEKRKAERYKGLLALNKTEKKPEDATNREGKKEYARGYKDGYDAGCGLSKRDIHERERRR